MPDTPPNITQIPAPRVDFIDKRTGLMAREWYRFFINLYQITGGGSSQASVEDLQLVPPLIGSDSQIAEIQNQLQSLFLQPPTPEVQRLYYGAFYDTTNQVAAVANTAYAITLNSTDFSYGVDRGSPTSRVIVNAPGAYNVQFSSQFTSTSASSHVVSIWFRINGTDVPYSATKITMQGSSGKFVAAWNFMVKMKTGDYFELMWATDNIAVSLEASAASGVVPAVPSTILTVSQVNLL